MKKSILIFSLLFTFSLSSLYSITDENTGAGVDRYAIYVGANYGGKSREKLLYAGSDARSLKKTMSEIGGISDSNCMLLIDPTKETIDEALRLISEEITSNANSAKRSEFIFYYSGHSDENNLLLGETKYSYSKLKAAITDVPSDIHVVILDSCYSGNFIRTKGGQKRKPFLVDDSSVVTGHAYLSSSSDNEYSQESDEIESSFFTNAMITGLRGAADTSGDNKVTLNELYSYAFNETLSKTESSKAGPQHPNFNITLVGSGDLVLSDLSTAEAMLSLSEKAKGKFIIRNQNDKLISEINKVEGQTVFMALPSGQYTALIVDDNTTKQGTFYLNKDQIYVLDQTSLNAIKRKTNRVRGDEEIIVQNDDEKSEIVEEKPVEKDKIARILQEEETYDDVFTLPQKYNYEDNTSEFFNLSFVPGFSLFNENIENLNISLGILGSLVHNLNGLQISNLLNISEGYVNGFQIASIGNIGLDKNRGIQGAFVFNIADKISGLQTAAVFNIASDTILGMQGSSVFNTAQQVTGVQAAGVFNIAGKVQGFQTAGIFSYAKKMQGIQLNGIAGIAGKIEGLQLSGIINIAESVDGVQLGLINIAKENSGLAIGLINIIGDGLSDLAFSLSTNDIFDIYFQTGTKKLYTVFGMSVLKDEMFSNKNQGAFYFGLGTQFGFKHSNFQLELLAKMAWADQTVYHQLYTELAKLDDLHKFTALYIPTAKITWNVIDTSFISFFINSSFEINIPNTNELAFTLYERKTTWNIEEFKVYPSLSFGGKIRLH